MSKLDPIELWLTNVAYSHSKSQATECNYRLYLKRFCDFIGYTPQQVIDEYEQLTDRQFKRKYAQYFKAFISALMQDGYAVGTVKTMCASVRSFFKYNDLPLGFIPVAKNRIAYHNRDLRKNEIVKISQISNPRDRAFFCMMTQSGLRPETLRNLKLKHIEPEFSKGIIPCKVEVPEELAKGAFGAYFTFIGVESVQYLRAYFAKRRGRVGPEDYLFTSKDSDKQLHRKAMTKAFAMKITRLKSKGLMDVVQEQVGKPRNVRLYNLRKYFRKQAGKAGVEYVNFWMGHKTNYKASHIPASDEHYFSREDVEFQRQLYKEKAMPFLRIEKETPTETEKLVREQSMRIEQLEAEVKELRAFAKFMEEKPAYIHIPDNIHGEERLKALTELAHLILSDIEEIKKTGKDFWERSAEKAEEKKKGLGQKS